MKDRTNFVFKKVKKLRAKKTTKDCTICYEGFAIN